MIITDLYGTVVRDTSKPLPAAPQPTREKAPPKPTKRERELEHDGNVYQGSSRPGRSYESMPISEDEEWLRHHNWREKRARVKHILQHAGTGPRGMDAFQNCGAECVVEWSDTEQRYRLRGSYCHNRHCEPCQKSKASLIVANLRKKLESAPNRKYRFVTLTLRHTPDTALTDQIKRLYTCYKKLRNTKAWKRSQFGGSAMLEVKLIDNGGWHPHLHLVTEGTWVDKRELQNAWQTVTGDSFVVDIRLLNSKKDVAYYVAKYMTKGTNADVWEDDDKAIEYVCAMRGVRTCATFGCWRGYKLLAKPQSANDFKPVAFLHTIAAAARRGEVASLELLRVLMESFQYCPGRRKLPPKHSTPENAP